jgi:multidrug efflux pump subunit AcrA (membrane-fusion protein)
MFGRLIITTGTSEQILVPEAAVLQIGQLDMVLIVVEGDQVLRRFVRLGRHLDGQVQVLSGLTAGERILARATR